MVVVVGAVLELLREMESVPFPVEGFQLRIRFELSS